MNNNNQQQVIYMSPQNTIVYNNDNTISFSSVIGKYFDAIITTTHYLPSLSSLPSLWNSYSNFCRNIGPFIAFSVGGIVFSINGKGDAAPIALATFILTTATAIKITSPWVLPSLILYFMNSKFTKSN